MEKFDLGSSSMSEVGLILIHGQVRKKVLISNLKQVRKLLKKFKKDLIKKRMEGANNDI